MSLSHWWDFACVRNSFARGGKEAILNKTLFRALQFTLYTILTTSISDTDMQFQTIAQYVEIAKTKMRRKNSNANI